MRLRDTSLRSKREHRETWETSQAQRDGDVSHVSHVSPNTGPGGYVATHIATAVYLDCETSGKDSRTCELTTVAAAIDGDAPMAFRHPEQRAEIQAALDAAAIVVGWNVAYDVRVLERHGYRVADRWQDAALKAYASGRGLPGQLALKPTALAELGESIDVALDVCRAPELWVEAASRRRKRWAKRAGRKVAEAHPTTWAEIPDKILAERCKMDVELTRELDHHYELDGRLPQLVELENALLGPVYRMEQRGAPVDVSALEALLAETLEEVTLARARVKGLDPTVLGKGGGICANPLEAALAARGVRRLKAPPHRAERAARQVRGGLEHDQR